MGVYKIIYNKYDKKVYEGEFEEDVREGRGSLYHSNGNVKYTGEWKNDKPNGIGVLFHENGNKFYEGKWEEGSACGQGVLFNELGRIEYEGQFEKSKKSGIGIAYYEDGSKYKGEWKDDEINGFGSFFYSTGELSYRGSWHNSKRDGHGIILSRENILIYQGSFSAGKRCGVGKSYYEEGKLEYDGQWHNDEMSGEGILYDKNGIKVFQGFFDHGRILTANVVKTLKTEVETDNLNENISFNNNGEGICAQELVGKDIGEMVKSFKQYNLENSNFEKSKNEENEYESDIENQETIENGYIELQENNEMKNDDKEGDELQEGEEDDELDAVEENENEEEEEAQEDDEEEDEEIDEDNIEDEDSDEYKDGNEYDDNINNYNEKQIKDYIYIDEDEKQEKVEDEHIDNIKIYKHEYNHLDNQSYSIKNIENEDKNNNEDIFENIIEDGEYIYQGDFNEFSKTGYGTIFFKEKKRYTGDLIMGVYDGYGKLFDFDENLIYEGNFKEGKRNGLGRSFDNCKNVIYDGEWKDDQQDGAGKLINSNGKEIYKGTFYKGKALGLSNSISAEIDNILYGELEAMVGLEEVKDDIARLVSFLKMQILRRRVSYKIMDIPYIFTFEGNIGVGKEAVARILGKIYYVLGFIPEYNFIQKDLSEALDYSHEGKIEKTMDDVGGGVLYLSNLYENEYDETTILVKDKSAINNIIDLVDYSNGHFIIIFSGNEELIETMIHSRKELAKLVGKSILFFDYSADEMIDFLKKLSLEKDYVLDDELIEVLKIFFEEMIYDEQYNSRNAEFLKELFTDIVKEQCIRIDSYGVEHVENLKRIELQDFKNIENKICF